MSYSNLIFGKDLYDLNLNDLNQFFALEKEETLNLEFKSNPPAANTANVEIAVLKAVCALMNSQGGIVIWGAPVESKNAAGNTTAQGALTSFTTNLDRDRIINKVSTLITPLPVGVRVQQIANAGSSVFVIEVEKSLQKPHQYGNHYYVRLDGQTRVAPHYLIEAMMKSIDFPIIRGHVRLKNYQVRYDNHILTLRMLVYNTTELNNDKNVFYRIMAAPGVIQMNQANHGSQYFGQERIVGKGNPIMGNFNVLIQPADLVANNGEVSLILNFGGEKSPSKTSSYTYSLTGKPLGVVADENLFLLSKNENRLPSDVSGNSDDENINQILDA